MRNAIVLLVIWGTGCFGQSDAEQRWYEEGKKFRPNLELRVSWIDPKLNTGFIEFHVPLTPTEVATWRSLQRARTALFELTYLTEKQFIAAHGLSRTGGCWELIGIRSDQDFIFNSVPANPEWGKPGCGEALKKKRARAGFTADGKPARGTP